MNRAAKSRRHAYIVCYDTSANRKQRDSGSFNMPLRNDSDQHPLENSLGSERQEMGSAHQSTALPDPGSSSPDDHLVDSIEPLKDLEIYGSGRALTEAAVQLLSEGRARFKSVYVFDFVPCNYEMLWDVLDGQSRGTFCEFGSGFGIATGLAELLGFDALGIELSPELVAASRDLLASQGLKARIDVGDYLQRRDQADIYFTYAWPSHMRLIEQHFYGIAKPTSKLVYCYGQDDIRCKVLHGS